MNKDNLSKISNKKALLIVSVGTSCKKTNEKNLDSIEKAITDNWSNVIVRRAFTSRTSISKAENKDAAHTTAEALSKLMAEDYKEIIIQPIQVIEGLEFEKIICSAMDFKGRFKKISIGRPLLSSRLDFIELIAALDNEYGLKDGKHTIFIGHGSAHRGNQAYRDLKVIFNNEGFEDVHIETLKRNSGFDSLLMNLKEKKIDDVRLLPLMISAGKHILEDIYGSSDESLKSVLESNGFSVEGSVKGLGEIDGIIKIFIRHVKEAMDGIEKIS
ncbi:sirohydrochlorin cobaltochelatase [Alkalibacter saccharofermentans]|uniref:Sirohydrochlorin cobaltochelatase n=1 Tax=Alkalibacter saccharofermentans DSM 14828 TaxID=1120975 RepID=A0A1M4SHR8_9FIRM|nr:sirohydrochlorin cobaltochelatase [Alkalibacter saccharofermentans]SHE31702.1 sirohydrochlorin cobaltochelatase [Alkalibacter saccharofermentans DSM 14828]